MSVFAVLVVVWMLMPVLGIDTTGSRDAKRAVERDGSASARLAQHSANAAMAAGAVRSAVPKAARANRDRQRADAVRQRVASRRAGDEKARSASGEARGASAAAGASSRAELSLDEQRRRREYLTRAVREQYIPVAKSCYEELLGRKPKAAGKVVVSFGIVGDGDAGVVESVELADGTTIDDPEFTLCVRESLYTTIFEPPPPGARETTVVYPLEFAP